jgi:hypothetical protein
MECDDGSGLSSRVYGGREDGVMGSLAARGVAESDRAGVWQAFAAELDYAIRQGWLELHDSGTFVMFTQSGSDLFA